MFLERDSELATLNEALGGLDSSGGRVVLVRGEAGIGKTTLVSRFLECVVDRAHVLVGGCDDLLTPQPLGPIWDMARQDASLSTPLADGDRRGVMEAMLDLLSRKLRPTVAVVEDVQWADGVTLDVVKFLGRRIARTNGLLVLTYRDGEVDVGHPLRIVIGELPPQNVCRLRLDRLSVSAVERMVEGSDLDLLEVLRLTGGNPLFVSEVLSSGVEQVPASVRDSVLARTARLSAGAREVLDLVSVVPGGAERDLIEEVLASSLEMLGECERRGLVRIEADTVSFHHELARRAVESALSDIDRRRLNRRVLATRISSGADPAVLVHHARNADDAEAIVEYAPGAARAALAVGSHREALDHFRTLEPYLHEFARPERAALLEEQARIEFYLDKVEALDTLARSIDLYRSTGSERDLARALSFAVRPREVSLQPDAAEACSLEAIAILEAYPAGADLAWALGQRGWLLMMRADRRAMDFIDRAIHIAEAVGDEDTIIHALDSKGCELLARGDQAGFEVLEESRRRAERHGSPFEEIRALSNMSSCAWQFLDVERARDLAQRAWETAIRHEIPNLAAYAHGQVLSYLLARGDWVAAEDGFTELLGSYPLVELGAAISLGALQTRTGRPEAHATVARAWSLAQTGGEPQHLGVAASTVAEHFWVTGADDPGLTERFREVLDAMVRLGDPLSAGELAFWLWELEHLDVVPDRISEPFRLVIEGRPAEAASIWEEKGFPYYRALALMHGDGADQLHALEILEGLGAIAVADRVRGILLDRGVRVPRRSARPSSGLSAGLTARQGEVLGLLAEGLTSPEIADRLFIARRTAENHVAAILTKLGVTSREDAAAAGRKLGLLTAS